MVNNPVNKTIAALDLGSNSFHILLAICSNDCVKIIHREKHLIRLRGEGENYFITQEKIETAVNIMRRFKDICNEYSAEIHAVATSSIREASNNNQLITRIKNETNIDVKIITGEEEADLVLHSLMYSISKLPQNYLLFDLGGGSTEFIVVENHRVSFKTSLKIGAVRFAQKYCDTDGNIQLEKEFISDIKTLLNEIKVNLNSEKNYECYGMGGTVSSAVNIVECNLHNKKMKFEKLKGRSIQSNELKAMIEILNGIKTLEHKKEIAGLEESRADVILVGMRILEAMIEELGLQKITFTGSGLREGIIMKAINAK